MVEIRRFVVVVVCVSFLAPQGGRLGASNFSDPDFINATFKNVTSRLMTLEGQMGELLSANNTGAAAYPGYYETLTAFTTLAFVVSMGSCWASCCCTDSRRNSLWNKTVGRIQYFHAPEMDRNQNIGQLLPETLDRDIQKVVHGLDKCGGHKRPISFTGPSPNYDMYLVGYLYTADSPAGQDLLSIKLMKPFFEETIARSRFPKIMRPADAQNAYPHQEEWLEIAKSSDPFTKKNVEEVEQVSRIFKKAGRKLSGKKRKALFKDLLPRCLQNKSVAFYYDGSGILMVFYVDQAAVLYARLESNLMEGV